MLLAAGALAPAFDSTAAPFLYAPGDLILTFRQPGAASDLVVNLGRAAAFSTLPPGTTVAITNLADGLLATAFSSRNGLRWSVAAANRPPYDASFPPQTLWVSGPRTIPDQPAAPWLRKGTFVQGNAGAQIDAIGVNAALTSSLIPGGPGNTPTAVVLPTTASFAIGPAFGPDSNYAGTFQGIPENITADDFEQQTSGSRSDLFELIPGTLSAGTLNAPARNLGTFEFAPEGTLVFRSAAPEGPPRPTILGVTRSGAVTTLRVASVAGASYRLRFSDASGLATPSASWTAGPAVQGTGSELALEDTSSDPTRFYIVEASRP